MNMRSKRIVAGLAVIAVGSGGVATAVAPAAPAATYKLSADKSKLKFNKSTIRAKAGKVTLSMSNPSPLPHDIGIQGKGHGKIVDQGRHLDLFGEAQEGHVHLLLLRRLARQGRA